MYLGGPSGLGSAPVITLTGESPDSAFGISVATAGDVNGDGLFRSDCLVYTRLAAVRAGLTYIWAARLALAPLRCSRLPGNLPAMPLVNMWHRREM